jgi:hypothetical protein
MSELKNCPFCGEFDIDNKEEYTEGGWQYSYQCIRCGASGSTSGNIQHRKEFQIEGWNTRPIEDAQAAEIEQLKARNAALVTELTATNIKADKCYAELEKHRADERIFDERMEVLDIPQEVVGYDMAQTTEKLLAKVAELEADNARMREALEDIRNSGGGNLYSEDAYDFIDIAREALKGEG